MKARINKQSGIVYLLGAMLGVTAATVQLANSIDYDQVTRLDHSAKIVGNQLSQYSNAVRIYVAEKSGDPGTPSNKSGVTWLKDSSCGGPASNPAGGYLPCGFPEKTNLSQTYTTTFSKNGSVLSASTKLSKPVLTVMKGYEGVLASKISYAASGAPTSSATGGTFNNYTSNPAVNMNLANAVTRPNFGVVESTASTNPVFDAWLRTDGSNAMKADIDMDGHSLVNVDRIEVRRTDGVIPYVDFSNDSYSDYDARLYLAGNNDLTLTGANLNVYGSQYTSGNITASGDIRGRNVNALGTVSSRWVKSAWSNAIVSDVKNRLYARNITLYGNTSLGFNGYNSDLVTMFRKIEQRLPRYAHKGTYLADHGWYIRKPNCPAGSIPKAIAIPTFWETSARIKTGGFSQATHDYRATTNYLQNANLAYWRTNTYSRIYSGGSNYTYKYGQILVNTYCDFG